MLDKKKVDLLEQYRERCNNWARAYALTYEKLIDEINRRRWFTKLWNRASFCIIFLSIFIGTLIPTLIANTVLIHYIQFVLVVASGILWIRFFWAVADGPEDTYKLSEADMVETVDTGDLKSPAG